MCKLFPLLLNLAAVIALVGIGLLCIPHGPHLGRMLQEGTTEPKDGDVVDTAEEQYVDIRESDLVEKIAGFWIGQLVGNFMGLPFEMAYIEDPMPVLPDRYYDRRSAAREGLRARWNIPRHIDKLQGAYTDDDTDIEFVTLDAVKKHGLSITYTQIADAWKTYVHDRINGDHALWLANYEALHLMRAGVLPPQTGEAERNKFWWTLDPQLVNEIWSAFYPGMVHKAVERAEWGAKITSSGWGTHPTMWYGALLSAAFVRSDVRDLYDIATTHVPPSSPFAAGLQDVKAWCTAKPADWRSTRRKIFNKYRRYPADCGTDRDHCGFGAIVNGLLGAMAVLYGDGDFLKTVGIAIAAGFDNDNQAATLGGFIGVLRGVHAIPRRLTHEIAGNNWSEPFNNMYVNERRPPLPRNNSISIIVEEIASIARTAIVQEGGWSSGDGDNTTHRVKVSGLTKQLASPDPLRRVRGDPQDGCCSECGIGLPWCSPVSGNCYSWSRGKRYYHSCCCSACAGAPYCSPVSGRCYDEQRKSYYRNCSIE